MTPKTSSPIFAAYDRILKLAHNSQLHVLDRETCKVALRLLQQAYAIRAHPAEKLLAEIANDKLNPMARVQDLNRKLIIAIHESGATSAPFMPAETIGR